MPGFCDQHSLDNADLEYRLGLIGAQESSRTIPLFVDPKNSSGAASDSNDGQSASKPILTTTECNARLRRAAPLSASTTITYMSDDSSGTGLDISRLTLGPFNLTVAGTPQVLHTGGTINAGTVAINPSAGGGGQRQLVHASDIATFAAFVFTGLGGTAANPARLIDTVSGSTAWIVAGTSTPSASNPTNDAVTAQSSLGIGHSYKIQRGSTLTLAATIAPTSYGGTVSFNNLALTATSVGPQNTSPSFAAAYPSVIFNHCSLLGPVLICATFNDCFAVNGVQGYGSITFNAGVLLPNQNNDECSGVVNFSSDTYITGASSLNIGRTSYQAVSVLPGFGSGLQIQDISTEGAGIFYQQGGCLGLFALLWGNGNTAGISMAPGTTLNVPVTPTPSITGSPDGDIAFELNSAAVFKARAVVNGQYTEAGGAATRNATWANLVATIASGGFGGAMCSPETQSAILVNS